MMCGFFFGDRGLVQKCIIVCIQAVLEDRYIRRLLVIMNVSHQNGPIWSEQNLRTELWGLWCKCSQGIWHLTLSRTFVFGNIYYCLILSLFLTFPFHTVDLKSLILHHKLFRRNLTGVEWKYESCRTETRMNRAGDYAVGCWRTSWCWCVLNCLFGCGRGCNGSWWLQVTRYKSGWTVCCVVTQWQKLKWLFFPVYSVAVRIW